ncbi:hypothetical protein GIB67_037961 [Kingdonia uniflora]|uniref:RING-type E3 ubiquitin transferase n=1 Tax=Kingdonia uniflora TaxID=39325 RepID=A0A7J7LH78_9MAGN|nr:hypothetical protein GIB67_037961 [Kingdonia uniflora]
MVTPLSSPSSPLKKPMFRVRVSSTPISINPLFFIIFFNISISLASSFSLSSSISYTQHCNSIVPESTPIPQSNRLNPSEFLRIRKGFFRGGAKVFNQNPSSMFPKSLNFVSKGVCETTTEGVLKINGVLRFRGARNGYSSLGNSSYGKLLNGKGVGGRLRTHRFKFPRREGLDFELEGYWNEVSGDLCMVGGSSSPFTASDGKSLDLSAVLKLNYSRNSTIFTSLVCGTLTSLDSADKDSYFEPVTMLAYLHKNYQYTLISKENLNGCTSGENVTQNNLDPGDKICSVLSRFNSGFKLEYGGVCDDVVKNCNILDKTIADLPSFMSFSGIQCSDERTVSLAIGFSNARTYGYSQPLIPTTTLVGEGVWDGEKNQLCIIACRILNFANSLLDASVGDCSIRLGLRFPKFLSIRNRNSVMGEIWSNQSSSDSGYFDKVVFWNSESRLLRVADVKYEYTMTGDANKSCSEQVVRKKGKRYPSGYSGDMRFDMTVKNNQGNSGWGYSVPYTVGDQFYDRSSGLFRWSSLSPEPVVLVNASYSRLLNVSYSIGFTMPPVFSSGVGFSPNNISMRDLQFQISAEGIYNTENGVLCMVGCRYLPLNHNSFDSMDCNILINAQFPPLNGKGRDFVKGSIESTREKRDPLYFERLVLSAISISTTLAEESVWRMDLEITMVLVSNTLVCIFMGLQLFYVKKHPDVVPSISLVMLIILTLGFMIPLVLNFEAMFVRSHNRQNVFVGGGGWLEVNEVLVRFVTMVAFLLQFRLLQLTWSARSSDHNSTGVWSAEKKSLYVTLSLYLVGGLIALIVHWCKNYYERPQHRGIHIDGYGKQEIIRYSNHYQKHSLLGDLRSYAGLGLDFFLLPQIFLNLFTRSKDTALSPAIYAGVTAVRLLPHVYDLYRVHSSIPYYDMTYIYANPSGDFFSTAWDVIIPCGGLFFAIVIFLQQRFGGQWILPRRFSDSVGYEKVSIAMVPFS